jgi:hypothetical protein
MPDFKDFAEKSGKSIEQIEILWKKAQEISIDTFGKEDYKFQIGALKNMLNLKEEKYLNFLKSDKKARDYINESVKEDAQVSGSLGNIATSNVGIKKSDDLKVNEDFSKDFLNQTAKDYDMGYDEVENISKKYPKTFYDELEQFIKKRKENMNKKVAENKDGDVHPDMDSSIAYRKDGDKVEENEGGGDDGSCSPVKKTDVKAVVKE